MWSALAFVCVGWCNSAHSLSLDVFHLENISLNSVIESQSPDDDVDEAEMTQRGVDDDSL